MTTSSDTSATVRPALWRCGAFELSLKRPLVMGILNLTQDSFSDGGRFSTPAAAIAAALQMVEAGADIIDIGAESTRPGARPVSEEEEWARLQLVLSALVTAIDRPISVDTRHPAIMARAIEAGAAIINDVGGFRLPEARAIVADSDVGVVSMHMQGDDPASMQAAPMYEDVCAEVGAFLFDSRRQLIEAGVSADRICLDPGFGFGKTLSHNLALFEGIAQWAAAAPVLVGISRKSMLGTITGQPVDKRLAASLAAALAAVQAGAHIVRVHDVPETVQALAVWSAIGLPAIHAGSVFKTGGHQGAPVQA
ncbi:MAG: dihydropteroate synthase [Lautropia sp.]|nr:dihydropteroate synthase [Lautropia sp.]